MSEQELTTRIREALLGLGILVWRNNTGAIKKGSRFIRYGLAVGSADLIGIMPGGRFLAIEVKLPGLKPTQVQAEFLEAVSRQGGLAFVTSDLDSCLAFVLANR